MKLGESTSAHDLTSGQVGFCDMGEGAWVLSHRDAEGRLQSWQWGWHPAGQPTGRLRGPDSMNWSIRLIPDEYAQATLAVALSMPGMLCGWIKEVEDVT